MSNVMLVRLVIVGFFIWSCICTAALIFFPDLPKRIAQTMAKAALGGSAKVTADPTNWWFVWFCNVLTLAIWVTFELWLKKFVT